ncbi:MAG: hypothetical protein VX270_04560, partial [Actinomycetota bacterium]|nr:hypothetical protein [Actinomycetota bacterium]
DQPAVGLGKALRGGGDEGSATQAAKNAFGFGGADEKSNTQLPESTQERPAEQIKEGETPPPPSFFNPTDTAATEEEAPAGGFFKPEAKPSSAGGEGAPTVGFFANAAAPTTTSGSTTRPSFFNPGGVTNSFFGGSGNNAFQADSDLDRDSEQEFESNND